LQAGEEKKGENFASFQLFRPAPDRLVLEKIAQRSGRQARDIVLLWIWKSRKF
jgi:hypothetical protein